MGRKKYFEDSMLKNIVSYGLYYERLAELSMSMFKWENVPETIDKRFLELTLFFEGKSLFFWDEVLGYLSLQCTLGGRMLVYQNPSKRMAYSTGEYRNKNLNEKNSVIIYNNYLRTNCVTSVVNFARKMYEIDQTLNVNIRTLKTPLLIQCTQNQKLSLVNVYKEYDGNSPVIFADKGLDLNSLRVLKTDAPFIADKLIDIKKKTWNEALTYLGINNDDILKKERLITTEAMTSQGDVYASRNSRLKARQEAVEKINSMFGLNMSVKYDDDYIKENVRLMNGIIEEEE